MAYQLAPFADVPLDADLLEHLIEAHESVSLPRLWRLWSYYRNRLAEPDEDGGSRGAPSQSQGLPARLRRSGHAAADGRSAREIVIENDIAWRIGALVDFMFPASPRFVSTATDAARREAIQRVLAAVFDANGGMTLWQDAALLGSVYGHVDFLLTIAPESRHASTSSGGATGAADASPSGVPSKPLHDDPASSAAAILAIETVEAPRAIALLNPDDYRRIDAYVLHYQQPIHAVDKAGWLSRLSRIVAGRSESTTRRATVTVTEIISATRRQRYEDGVLADESFNLLGRVPVVHVQNIAQPLVYPGVSDVEPLIPLQDELNTRLSDRANRVTMQSFRMYLGVGIDGFTDRPIGPGQMWMTDNPEARITAFGGDADSPSEEAHIRELREALDKASGVTPAAAGHINAKIGNLTSENALRISLMGTLARIKRKRLTYGAAMRELAELILHALDVLGVFHTTASERGVEIAWPDPLPVDETRRIEDALKKAQLGVPLETLRAELGYAETHEG